MSTSRFFFRRSTSAGPVSALTYTAPTIRSRFFDSTGAAASALQPAVHAPDVVGQVAAQRVRDDLRAADEVAVFLFVVADARDHASLGVDGDDRIDAAAREVRDQRAEAVLDRVVEHPPSSPEPREAASSDSAMMASRPSLPDAVDPLVGVDLEHLLGGVLRAVEALPFEGASRHSTGRGR